MSIDIPLLKKEAHMKQKAFWLSTLVVLLWSSSVWAISLVDADWLKKNLENKSMRIVEVPEKADAIGDQHLPGKLHIHGAVVVNRYLDLGNMSVVPPTLYPSKEQYEKLMSRLGITPETTVVAYDDKFSLFASRLLVIMELYGHDTNKLKLLNGGLVNWKKLGYPTLDGHIPVSATKYKVDKINPILLTWSDIYRDVVSGARPEVILVDVRPQDEFLGKNIRTIRGGHIPHAVNVVGTDANNKEDHTFKSADEIRKLFEAKGVTSDKPIYEYCHSGDRTAHAYVILKYILGFKDVKVYDGSWIEWATLLSLPAEDQVWYTEKK